ncbi:MAG: hypothetical protein ACI9EX_001992 [Oleispira sp.]|jgi:uncharacterized protein (TIGR03545 family)
MKQWIRWSGLAGFFALSALFALGWIFAAGPIIKYSIETFGSQAANATVEVDSIRLTFDPFGIEMQGLQIANADKPMENLLQFDRATADIELLPLLLGKGIVNEVALTGLAFSTPRQSSGALSMSVMENESLSEEEKEAAAEDSVTSMAQKSLPTAEALLSREPLLTEQRGSAFKNSFQTIKNDSNKAIAALPDSNAFVLYEDDFNRITSGRFDSLEDFQQRKKEFDGLKKRIKRDQKAISQATQVLADGKQNLQGQWSDLQKAPAEDFNILKGKYTLDSGGAANVSQLLFGDQVGEWSQQGLYWYEKVRPFLVSDDEDVTAGQEDVKTMRSEGRFVHYPTDRPLPDLLIRQVNLAVESEVGQIAVSVYDVTHQQDVIDRPTRIIASGKGLTNIKSLDLTGSLDHRVVPGKDVFELVIKNFVLNDYNVGAMGLKLDRSELNINAKAELMAGDVDGNTLVEFTQSKFSSKDKTRVAIETAKALANVDSFNINAKAKGRLTSPEVSIESDLDTQLSQAFNQRFKEQQQELEVQLRKSLNQKLLFYAGDYQAQLKAMDLASGSLSNKQARLKSLANAELSSFQDQQKADAERKVAQKKKEEQDKVKAAADKKKKQLEDKVKDRLKNLF